VADLLNQKVPVFDALRSAGRDAAEITEIFWVMAVAGGVIWLAVTALALYAGRSRGSPWSEQAGLRLILIGGCMVPALVLAALLAYGMPALARQRTFTARPDVRITVIGEQWWWRVRYEQPGGGSVELANEVRLPRDRVTEVTLTSPNVIHAFWVPALAGKVDMIPGRMTRLKLEPLETGTYRGWCAEYCGASHARMAFVAEVMEPGAFDQWLSEQSRPAANVTAAGAEAFFTHGCAACHAIRGTAAAATIGPDLTHIGSRRSLAAGTLPNDTESLVRFLARPSHIKPGALMPPFEALPAAELRRLAEYLRSLQ
jgi:cytochrome c oxidase subunit II